MAEGVLLILFVALLLDWFFGEPAFLWSRVSHPVVAFGKGVSLADRWLNRQADERDLQTRKGAFAISFLIVIAVATGLLLNALIGLAGPVGMFLEVFVVFVLLAQKSLFDHVKCVADGLAENGLAGGRKAVAMIVGRDPQTLDLNGVCRASIESLAENFSDGVVAPVFWYAVFGLPGILAYKMINTADSMIGYRNGKYLWFGRAAAKIDDLANWVPARISAGLICLAVGLREGAAASGRVIKASFRDARLHRSPNAGWPETAMASALEIALGGPRVYHEEAVPQACLNSSGRRQLTAKDIMAALGVFTSACHVLWGLVLVALLVF